MKKIITILCAAMMTMGAVKAEVLLTEHFAQTTETLATNTDAMPYSGEIATEGWTNIMGTSGEVFVNTSQDLLYTGYKSATDNTGSAEYKATFGRRVASPLSASVNSGSVYMAGIVKISSIKSSGKDYLWALGVGTSGLNSASSKHYARPYVMQSGNGFKFGIAKLDETSTATYIDYTEEEYAFGTYLIVVEYTWVDGDKNDIINMYINPAKGAKPASATCAPKPTQASIKNDAASFGSIILYASNTSQAACLIDELKVVTDWDELWEEGSVTPTSTIEAEESAPCGFLPAGKAWEKTVVISGKDLTDAISVSTNNNAIVPAVTSISKADAEAQGGYALTLTITPNIGEGSGIITLSSTGATDKEIHVSWIGVNPSSNIAAMKTTGEEDVCALANEPIVIYADGQDVIVQDNSGAIVLTEYFGGELAGVAVGDKLSNIVGEMSNEEGYHLGFQTVFLLSKVIIKSSGNPEEPLLVTTANYAQYGPALVKIADVTFDTDASVFAKGTIMAIQNEISAPVFIPEGCDIIGEAIPATADIRGIVSHPAATDVIQIRSKEDVAAKSGTGIQQTDLSVKSRKIILNGQLVIVKDGKMFNVLGTEL